MFKIKNFIYENHKEKKYSAGIIFFSKSTKKFLLLLRSPKLPQGNTWSSVGGKLEKDENAKEAAKREAKEEIGFDGNIKLKLLYVLKRNYINFNTNKPTLFKYYTFIGFVENEFIPNFNSSHGWENIDYKWLSLEDLLKLSNKHPGLTQMLIASKNKLYNFIK